MAASARERRGGGGVAPLASCSPHPSLWTPPRCRGVRAARVPVLSASHVTFPFAFHRLKGTQMPTGR